MRLLYLDDSGKLHPNDSSTFVTFGGFSIDESQWHPFVRRVSGAKRAFFPNRDGGNPNLWEIKSTDFLKPSNIKKKVYQRFFDELLRILKQSGCRAYGVRIPKDKLIPPVIEEKYIPLAFQRLIAKFYAETQYYRTTGSVVCDWSAYDMDHHLAQCVVSSVISRNLTDLIGGVTYGSSHSLVPIQVADLISGAINRQAQGRSDLDALVRGIKSLQLENRSSLDIDGFPVVSVFNLF
jgi:hypothetical protein